MVNKIRRLKITVRTKEMVVLEHGTDHKTQVTDDTNFATCPVCHAPMKTLPRAELELASTETALEKKSTK